MRRGVLVFCLIALCVAGVVGWVVIGGASAPPKRPATPAVVPVVAQKVTVENFPIVLTGLGTVTAYNVVNVKSQITGTIVKVGFTQGQQVKPGDLLVEIDPRPYQAALAEAQATLAKDQATLANDQINLGRYTKLFKQGGSSAQQVADDKALVEEMTATVASDKAAVSNAETQLSYTKITSPIAGVTGILNVDIGNVVQANATTPIVTITQIEPIYVQFTLPETNVPEVQAAMSGGKKLATAAFGPNGKAKLGDGTLLLMNNTVSATSGTVTLEATFPNQNHALWPGEFVDVQLTLGTQPNAIVVPMPAVQQGQNGAVIWVVQADGTVKQQPVTMGEQLGPVAWIKTGLAANDVVVVRGQYGLTQGAHVQQVPANDPNVQNTTAAASGML